MADWRVVVQLEVYVQAESREEARAKACEKFAHRNDVDGISTVNSNKVVEFKERPKWLGMSVCSEHQYVEAGCPACFATPAKVLGITEDAWSEVKAKAEATGLAKCVQCGFEQYRNHDLCVLCGVSNWEGK